MSGIDAGHLRRRFGREDSPGWSRIAETEAGSAFVRTGAPATLCWAWALEARADLAATHPGAEVSLVGFWCSSNPGTALESLCDGHDFALVEGRWIVDGWIAFVEGRDVPTVLDLEDPADAAMIATWYGDRRAWQVDGETVEA